MVKYSQLKEVGVQQGIVTAANAVEALRPRLGDLFSDVAAVSPQEMAQGVSVSEARENAYFAAAQGRGERWVAYWRAVMWEAERPRLRRARIVKAHVVRRLREAGVADLSATSLQSSLGEDRAAATFKEAAELLIESGELSEADLYTPMLFQKEVVAKECGQTICGVLQFSKEAKAVKFAQGEVLAVLPLTRTEDEVTLLCAGALYRLSTDDFSNLLPLH